MTFLCQVSLLALAKQNTKSIGVFLTMMLYSLVWMYEKFPTMALHVLQIDGKFVIRCMTSFVRRRYSSLRCCESHKSLKKSYGVWKNCDEVSALMFILGITNTFRAGRGADPHHPHLECRGPRKSRPIPLVTLRSSGPLKRVKTFLLTNFILQYLLTKKYFFIEVVSTARRTVEK